MDIVLGTERVYCLKPELSIAEAKEYAWDKKTNVFGSGITGILNRSKAEEVIEKARNKKTNIFGSSGGVSGFLNRSAVMLAKPKPEDIRITGNVCRYEPFWHITCNVTYVYDRNREYDIPTDKKEVKYVTVDKKDYQITKNPRQFTIQVVEHCVDENSNTVIYNGVSGQEQKWKKYLGYEKELVEDLSNFSIDGCIIIAPEIHASNVVHKVLNPLFKAIQFTKIIEQKAVVSEVDLYFRPVYAYEYEWITMGKTAVAEFDGLTGEMLVGENSLGKQVQKVMNRDLIFDVSQEAANLILPGSGIAVRVIKEITKKQDCIEKF